MSARAGAERLGSSERSLLCRGWLMSASIAVTEAHGIRKLTVARILEESTVTRKVLYDTFESAEDCLHAALEQTISDAAREASEAYDAADSWLQGMRAALSTLLSLAEQRRGLARVCVVEAMGAGPPLLALRRETLERVAGVIACGGRPGRDAAAGPLTAEGIAGALAELLHKRLSEPDGSPLTDLYGPMMSIIVLPYLGAATAVKEQQLAPPPAARRSRVRPAEVNLLRASGLRLTERTVKVLVAIAARPGSSNLELAAASGIVDQGQISKLLARLRERGLAERESRPGGPNAWTLTPVGEQIATATLTR